ncbi:PhnD/SsuA/transferrin family substrate-binding protein [Frigidibacter sp. RF13]|uniref:phosphate/phosphite/phosphonate ABC transporter substrate-binding protein n=1 Tax=Frigidibacter sp. RF13 TaxID=2997340 RepID=UPI00226E76BF|nr:PhnD/SsuA/transferrin family substrate-binding protein [Frigidibacter sp. RF13]MCY1127763.1 PhnD/SsuA/transferrin family substrate-binding protein [Frigidibacter sp. RF13]
MIASLPMYDWPEVQPANDQLWASVRDRLRATGLAAPETLSRDRRAHDWTAPDLLLSQTCGFPYRTALHGKVTLVGTPDYGLEGAPPGYYYSVLVVPADRGGDWQDFIDGTLAINGYDSQSGWAAPQNHAAGVGRRFGRILVTGAHRDSATAVADGEADIAAIDAMTWRLVEAYRPDVARRLRICARTTPTPGLPLITALRDHAGLLRTAFAETIAALAPEDRKSLHLQGVVQIPASAYLAVPTPPGM